tara:strand:- start:767 stop:1300 length:534 start_codon:yes stop_codon:yes gene_type:complete
MNKSELSDLMSRISIDRDEIAFSNIFDFLAPKINSFFLQNGINSDNAEELTQDVMSTIWLKCSQYNPSKSAVTTWIYTIARNKKIDFIRKKSKINHNEDDVREFLYEDNMVDKIQYSEIRDQVDKINSQLSPNQRKIIKMNFFENKSHKIIAEELEIPLGTVKSRIRHILSKMQELL